MKSSILPVRTAQPGSCFQCYFRFALSRLVMSRRTVLVLLIICIPTGAMSTLYQLLKARQALLPKIKMWDIQKETFLLQLFLPLKEEIQCNNVTMVDLWVLSGDRYCLQPATRDRIPGIYDSHPSLQSRLLTDTNHGLFSPSCWTRIQPPTGEFL